ncbi:hypothetical protein [Streptomyces marianii]|uniref:Uncharacterized protein n=1 Tax=Streptomyces marianii TaxID=1817406 RepID=A0A5R9E8S9_9ACTN|nr:hypothetical protein [Streptomyces marianii]TLQ46296.1 hypothetical protein FEF34_27920 [Streptomyces marianii]
MSEQHVGRNDQLSAWLPDLPADAYALAWVAPTTGWRADSTAPAVGLADLAREDFDPRRLSLEEIARDPKEALRCWVHFEDGQQQLAIIRGMSMREYAPGELAAALMNDAATDRSELSALLSDWFHRRYNEAPQGLEPGWIAAAVAWTCHMRAFTGYPPPQVLAPALARAGAPDDAIRELITNTAVELANVIDRLERTFRSREEFVEDWRLVEPLTADVPVLHEAADWLLDQIALRDAQAQQLRAVLEPDTTDHQIDHCVGHDRDRHPVLDAQRAAHLEQARQTVRAYTAAAYGGRQQAAQRLLESFPGPARSLQVSGPATAWREQSHTAQGAWHTLAARLHRALAEGAHHLADPDLLHAETVYLTAREGQLQLVHDALGRLANPAPALEELPTQLAGAASALTQRRIAEAFGTTERARQFLDGQIAYLRQEPVPAHRRDVTAKEIRLLTAVLHQLDRLTPTGGELDVERIRQRLEAAMSRPTAATPWEPAREQSGLAQALGARSSAPGVRY